MNDQNSAGSSKMTDFGSAKDAYRRSRSNSLLSKQNSIQRLSNVNDDGSIHETPKRIKYEDSINGSLNNTDTDNIPPSPWEWRRMRGEIISLKTRISHHESTIEQLHRVRREIEEVFHKEKKIFEIQAEEQKQTIKQLELRIDVGRRNLQDAKTAQAIAERDLIQMKSTMEQKVLQLVDDNTKLTEELRELMRKESKPVINAVKPESKSSEGEEKLEIANKRISELETKIRELRDIQQKFEVQSIELKNLQSKIESFESEKVTTEESKIFRNQAAKAIIFEKELHQAKNIIASLKESVRGKLLLEEQMANMEHRLKRTENLEKQVFQLEVSQGELLSKIAEYEAIGIIGGPIAIKREIQRLQNSEAVLTAEEGQLRSKVNAIERELKSMQLKLEETQKSLTDTTVSNERLTRFVYRLQKKISLVTRERDSYKQQLDIYEKEITGNQSESASLINDRIPALERTIESYRDLVTKLETDLENADGTNQSEECKKLKEEIDKLKDELEHRALKGDFNINTRILHFKMNPAAIAEQQAEEKQKALLQEVEQLRIIVSSGNQSGTPQVSSSLQAQEIAELQKKHEIKISRLKEAFKASSHEYRQTCYQLFGWRVDRTKEGHYKLSSQYAESPDDYLFFIVNEDGVNMIETPFSATLTTFIERHLQQQHSVPMFLNAVQCDLFDQQTVTNIVTS